MRSLKWCQSKNFQFGLLLSVWDVIPKFSLLWYILLARVKRNCQSYIPVLSLKAKICKVTSEKSIVYIYLYRHFSTNTASQEKNRMYETSVVTSKPTSLIFPCITLCLLHCTGEVRNVSILPHIMCLCVSRCFNQVVVYSIVQ